MNKVYNKFEYADDDVAYDVYNRQFNPAFQRIHPMVVVPEQVMDYQMQRQ